MHLTISWLVIKNIPALMIQANDNHFQVSALPDRGEVITPIMSAVDLLPEENGRAA